MFLEPHELKSASIPEIINNAVNNNEDVVRTIIQESIQEMRSYLSERFDVDAIFEPIPEATTEEPEPKDKRNKVIIKHLKKIVIFEIYQRRGDAMTESVEKGYNEALNWLEKVASGKIPAGDLPYKPEDAEDIFIKFGGNTKFNSNW